MIGKGQVGVDPSGDWGKSLEEVAAVESSPARF